MSERKHRSINWNALYGWFSFVAWLSAFLWASIEEVGTVDCDGTVSSWWLVILVIAVFTSLFISGLLVGLPKKPSKGNEYLIQKCEDAYNKLNDEGKREADAFIEKLYNEENKIIK